MKANAPEKIYVHVRANKELGTTWHGKKITNSDIEYTRTDAFIEKAADCIKKDMLDNLAFQGRLNRIEIIDGIIERFIKAIEGK